MSSTPKDQKCNYAYDKISPDELKLIESRMYPGSCSQFGFLQPGEKLGEIVEKDRLDLEKIGITHAQIADVLKTVHGKFKRLEYLNHKRGFSSRNGLLVDDRYLVSEVVYNGAQECPFQNQSLDAGYHGYEYGDRDITIEDTKTGDVIKYNSLLPHMVKEHQFFESPNCEHRLDFLKVIRMFELIPGINYEAQKRSFLTWRPSSSSSSFSETEKKFYDAVCLEKFTLSVSLHELGGGLFKNAADPPTTSTNSTHPDTATLPTVTACLIPKLENVNSFTISTLDLDSILSENTEETIGKVLQETEAESEAESEADFRESSSDTKVLQETKNIQQSCSIIRKVRCMMRDRDKKDNEETLERHKNASYQPCLYKIQTDEEIEADITAYITICSEYKKTGKIDESNYKFFELLVYSTYSRHSYKGQIFGMNFDGYLGMSIFSCNSYTYVPINSDDIEQNVE